MKGDHSVRLAVLTFIGALVVFFAGVIINAASPYLNLLGIAALVTAFATFAAACAYLTVGKSTRRNKTTFAAASAVLCAAFLGVTWLDARLKEEKELALISLHMKLQQTLKAGGSISAALVIENRTNEDIAIPRFLVSTGETDYKDTIYRDIRPEQITVLSRDSVSIPVATYRPGSRSTELIGEFEFKSQRMRKSRLARVTFHAEMAPGVFLPASFRNVDDAIQDKKQIVLFFLAGYAGELTFDLNKEDGEGWGGTAEDKRHGVKREFQFTAKNHTATMVISCCKLTAKLEAPGFPEFHNTVTIRWDDLKKRYSMEMDNTRTATFDLLEARREFDKNQKMKQIQVITRGNEMSVDLS